MSDVRIISENPDCLSPNKYLHRLMNENSPLTMNVESSSLDVLGMTTLDSLKSRQEMILIRSMGNHGGYARMLPYFTYLATNL